MTAVIPRVWTLGVVVLTLGCTAAIHPFRTASSADSARPAARSAGSRMPVRSEDPTIAALLADTIRQSPTVARLVHDIGLTDGIVYIQPRRCPVPGLRGCLLHLMGHAYNARYLWIRVQPGGDLLGLASTIAHELQHALEVLQVPSIRSTWAMVQFYRSPETRAFAAGTQGAFQSYETAAAIAVAATVRIELTAFIAAAADTALNSEAPIPP